jgi:hypothetical protein
MLEKISSRLDPRQPMLDSTRAVGDSVVLNALRLKRIAVEILKTIAKCWAFFKDVHFSIYVIIPVISSFTSLDRTASSLLWALFFLPILIVITFAALDSIFDLGVMDTRPNTTRRAPPLFSATPRARRMPTFGPMFNRNLPTPTRRHRALRPIRSRRRGDW